MAVRSHALLDRLCRQLFTTRRPRYCGTRFSSASSPISAHHQPHRGRSGSAGRRLHSPVSTKAALRQGARAHGWRRKSSPRRDPAPRSQQSVGPAGTWRYAYFDESGNVSLGQTSERFLVVATVIVDGAAKRRIELHMRRLEKNTSKKGRKAGSEIKASLATDTDRIRLLTHIAAEDIAIVATILDKGGAKQRPDDPEDWYRLAVGTAARVCVRRWPDLYLVIDKRYTMLRRRQQLEEDIRARLADLLHHAEITQPESQATPGLRVADFVAWAIRQKYERHESRYYELIKGNIISEFAIVGR